MQTMRPTAFFTVTWVLSWKTPLLNFNCLLQAALMIFSYKTFFLNIDLQIWRLFFQQFNKDIITWAMHYTCVDSNIWVQGAVSQN